jgi:type II secretory pathway component PulK
MRSGSILIFVSWVLVFIALFSLSLGYTVHQRLRVVDRLEEREKLRLVAEAGVKKAMEVINREALGVDTTFDALGQPWSNSDAAFRDIAVGDGFFTVKHVREPEPKKADGEVWYGVVDEERKLNLNEMKTPDVLRRLVQAVTGASESEAAAISESILDWRDADDARYLSGAESRYYRGLTPAYEAKNEDFQSLEELLYVKGVTSKVYAHLLPYVTLRSSGNVNINTASRNVLQALGLDTAILDKYLAYRKGPDGVTGTTDDQVVKLLTSLPETLNNQLILDDTQTKQLSDFIGAQKLDVKSKYFTVHSFARMMNQEDPALVLSCIINRSGEIQSWRETFL